MTFAEIAAETRTDNRDEWARAVWERVRIEEPDEAFALVGYVIRDELRRLERAPVRRLELAGAVSAIPLHLQVTLMGEPVWVPGIGLRPWGEMTSEEHRLTAGYWLSEAEILKDNASRHMEAAASIEAAHVTCLNDIPERAKAMGLAKPRTAAPKPARVLAPA